MTQRKPEQASKARRSEKDLAREPNPSAQPELGKEFVSETGTNPHISEERRMELWKKLLAGLSIEDVKIYPK